uniref:Exonuclease 3'-5' domain-containing protein 2 n=2 Tax=Clastoptera arizonana TaxID=38151 RepID=A0A1B6E4P1_9HEMI
MSMNGNIKKIIYCLTSITISYIIIKNIKIRKYLETVYKYLHPDVTKIVCSESEGKYVVNLLNRKCKKIKVLGLDCEWVQEKGHRNPVALLQLATTDGYCSIFQLCHIRNIPTELFELLKNESIFKVGVGIHNDATNLMLDYGLKCEGFLDLRHLAQQGGNTPSGLSGLARAHLGVELDKNWRIRCSNWELEKLSPDQISYAAQDARVAVDIFHKLNKQELERKFGRFKCLFWSDQTYWDESKRLWTTYINKSFKSKSSSSSNLKNKPKQLNLKQKREYHTLGRPYYDNIYLLAPDNQVLSTISEAKSEWYLQKGLADIVCEEPKKLKLRFEPAGREGIADGYYTHAKKNICVVCGSEKSIRRKIVVPQEYRKHFPVHLKEHNSHDVLLLCMNCHMRSNMKDQCLRNRLAEMCNAPLKEKDEADCQNYHKVKKAIKALYFHADSLPEKRIHELNKVICDNLDIEDGIIEKEMLEELLKMKIVNEKCSSHGKKVVEHFFSKEEELEKLWRQNFVDTMSPEHLPELWSIDYKRS